MKRSVHLCTPDQKERVEDHACLVCGAPHVDPAHLVDRSLAPSAADDVRAVVPLCRRCHVAYDDHKLDLSPHLEPHWRDSLSWAVEAVGLWKTVRRVTGRDWMELAA